MASRKREPVFNVPGVVLIVLVVFLAVHAVRQSLPATEEGQLEWLIALGFIPARYTGFASQLPGGHLAALTSPFTHLITHADNMHVAVNSAWWLAFGSVLGRRIGPARLLLFAIASGLAGALLFLAFNWGALNPVIGASGAIAGLMGGVMRFLFKAIDDGQGYLLRENPERILRAPLLEALRDSRVLGASGVFLGINVLTFFGLDMIGAAGPIAWEAHVGGFLFGILCFAAFDIAPQKARQFSSSGE